MSKLRKITLEELNEILKNHELWLNSNGKEGERADLSYTDLSCTDLSYTDLSYTDLRYANLRYASIIGANLDDANLFQEKKDSEMSYSKKNINNRTLWLLWKRNRFAMEYRRR